MGTDGARCHAIPFDMPGPLALVRFPLDRLFPVMKLSPSVDAGKPFGAQWLGMVDRQND
jgi:hypothetical protein